MQQTHNYYTLEETVVDNGGDTDLIIDVRAFGSGILSRDLAIYIRSSTDTTGAILSINPSSQDDPDAVHSTNTGWHVISIGANNVTYIPRAFGWIKIENLPVSTKVVVVSR